MAQIRTVHVGDLMDAGCWQAFLESYNTDPSAQWDRDDRVAILIDHLVEWGLMSA